MTVILIALTARELRLCKPIGRSRMTSIHLLAYKELNILDICRMLCDCIDTYHICVCTAGSHVVLCIRSVEVNGRNTSG